MDKFKGFNNRVECQREKYDPKDRRDRFALKIIAVQDERIPVRIPSVVMKMIVQQVNELLSTVGFSQIMAMQGALENVVHDLEGDMQLLNMPDDAEEMPACKRHITCSHHEDCKQHAQAQATNAAKEKELVDSVIPAKTIADIIGALAPNPVPDQQG